MLLRVYDLHTVLPTGLHTALDLHTVLYTGIRTVLTTATHLTTAFTHETPFSTTPAVALVLVLCGENVTRILRAESKCKGYAENKKSPNSFGQRNLTTYAKRRDSRALSGLASAGCRLHMWSS